MTIKYKYLALCFLMNSLMINIVRDEEAEMVLIPVDEFNIGESKKLIYLDYFYIDKTEVTQEHFNKIMGPTNFF